MSKRQTEKYMSLPYNPSLVGLAKELRKAGVLSEVLLWKALKRKQINGWDFDRQKIIGDYIVDFFCANNGLVIEIDEENPIHEQEYYQKRDEFLKEYGLTVIRISDMDVKRNLEGVLSVIRGTFGGEI